MGAKYIANRLTLSNKAVTIYASPKVGHALHEVTKNLNLYEGVQLIKVLEAVYAQGKKDGARTAFEALSEKVKEAEKLVPHKNPGKPKKAK